MGQPQSEEAAFENDSSGFYDRIICDLRFALVPRVRGFVYPVCRRCFRRHATAPRETRQ